MPVPFNDEV